MSQGKGESVQRLAVEPPAKAQQGISISSLLGQTDDSDDAVLVEQEPKTRTSARLKSAPEEKKPVGPDAAPAAPRARKPRAKKEEDERLPIVATPGSTEFLPAPAPAPAPILAPILAPTSIPQTPVQSSSMNIVNLMNDEPNAPSVLASQPDALVQLQTPTTGGAPSADKPKAPPRKRKPADPTKTVKKVAKKKEDTPQDLSQPTFNELQNQSLKQPNPNTTLPPPQVIEAPADSRADGEESIIAIHVPLYSKDEAIGSTQVVFNVMKMCEDKYGWKNVHPNASKFNIDMYNDEELDEDDDDDMEDYQDEAPKEPKENAKVDGRKLQKGKPKIGQYDFEDPFIDDSEMLWEEQRASTKDGFFVFWGPLVEEGKNARIDKADGTAKRSRKRAAGASASVAKKKQSITKPAVPIAPQPSATAPLQAIAPATQKTMSTTSDSTSTQPN